MGAQGGPGRIDAAGGGIFACPFGVRVDASAPRTSTPNLESPLESILGLVPTGRELRDPAARLIEAKGEDGRTYTVVDFDPVHDGHAALTLNVEMVLSFMEYPMVTGLVELAKHDVAAGHFAYPTGSVWLLADILRAYGDFGQVVGLRAAMELAWLVGQILVEAGDTGPMQGCFSHGNLNPWRIALRADGEVQVVGYGLPQVELIRHRDDDGPAIEAASLRYCPPERLEGVPEDASADTYSLTLVAYEVATGKPLYGTHDVSELERIVGMSEGAHMLSRENLGLPPKVAKVLARALVYDPDTRLSGQEYVDAIGRLLATEHMEGPSLTEVVETLQGHQKSGAPRGRKLVSAVSTSMFTPDQLADMVDDDEDESDASEPQAESRWKKVERPRKEGDAEEEVEEESPKRRTRRGEPEPAARGRRTRRGEPEPAQEAPSRPRRRNPGGEPPPEPPAEESPSRRRRRRSEEEDRAGAEATPTPAPEPEPEPVPPPPPEPTRGEDEDDGTAGRRSRRRKAPEPDQEAAAAGSEPETPSRRRRKAPEEEAEPPSEPVDTASTRRRRRAPDEEDEAAESDSDGSRRTPAPDDDASDSDSGSPPRRRRRPVDDDEEEDDDAPRRRRRRTVDEDEEEEDASPRRRRRRPADD